MHSNGEGVKLVELSIRTGEGLSMFRDLRTETQGVKKAWELMSGVSEYVDAMM